MKLIKKSILFLVAAASLVGGSEPGNKRNAGFPDS